MTHYTFDKWQKYVKDELDNSTRDQLEAHLYACDQCLNHYLLAIEANETSLPALSSEESFTDLVMAEVSRQNAVPDTKSNTSGLEMVPDTKKKPFYQQAAFHYLLAAAATLFLMFSGAFQSLARYAGSIDTQHVQERKPSVTEGVVNKTFAWMDSLEKKEAIKK